MSKVSKVHKAFKASKESKTLAQNIELQIMQIVSDGGISSDNILHDGNDGVGEAKTKKLQNYQS